TLFIVTLMLSGCGEQMPEGLPPLYPCTLTFTQNGAPLAGGIVSLVPVEASLPFSFSGLTDARGSLTPMVQGKYKGIPAGKWKIGVRKEEFRTEGNFEWAVTLVDKQYYTAADSPLEIVIAKGKNNFTFDVGAAVEERTSEKAPKTGGGK
ncbi:MAG: hypothetical protein LBT46_10865, partial [Planctomycetaceae bacterium]|nr:hypothetical protein [Planctomycetaceae bacterium]